MVMTGALCCWYYKISAQLIAIPLGLTSSYAVREESLLEEEKKGLKRYEWLRVLPCLFFISDFGFFPVKLLEAYKYW